MTSRPERTNEKSSFYLNKREKASLRRRLSNIELFHYLLAVGVLFCLMNISSTIIGFVVGLGVLLVLDQTIGRFLRTKLLEKIEQIVNGSGE